MEQRADWKNVGRPRGEARDVIWLRSIGGSLVGVVIGLSNMVVVQRFLPDLIGAFFAVAWGGVVAGAMQGGFMRRYTQPAWVWLTVTAIGWIAGFITLQMPDWSLLTPADLPFSRLVLVGAMVSVPQWWMLRRNVGRAWCWVVISIGCWWFASLFTLIFVL